MNADGKTRDPGKDARWERAEERLGGARKRRSVRTARARGPRPAGEKDGRRRMARHGGTPQAGVARKRRDEAGRLPFRAILASPGLRKRLGLRGTRTRTLITTALRASSKRTRSRPEPAPAPVAGARNVARGLPTPRDLCPPAARHARCDGHACSGPPPSGPRHHTHGACAIARANLIECLPQACHPPQLPLSARMPCHR